MVLRGEGRGLTTPSADLFDHWRLTFVRLNTYKYRQLSLTIMHHLTTPLGLKPIKEPKNKQPTGAGHFRL